MPTVHYTSNYHGASLFFYIYRISIYLKYTGIYIYHISEHCHLLLCSTSITLKWYLPLTGIAINQRASPYVISMKAWGITGFDYLDAGQVVPQDGSSLLSAGRGEGDLAVETTRTTECGVERSWPFHEVYVYIHFFLRGEEKKETFDQ